MGVKPHDPPIPYPGVDRQTRRELMGWDERQRMSKLRRQHNEERIKDFARSRGICPDWAFRRLLNGLSTKYCDPLDLLEETLYKEIDIWIDWELSPETWSREFEKEFGANELI